MKKHIPNILTLCNLVSGCLAVVAAYNADYQLVLLFVVISAVFDFLDGFAARLLKAYSPVGKELDSLADVISFGFAPAMIAVSLLGDLGVYRYFGLLIVALSALRLAKFNLDDSQTDSFIGMPTPANAIFWGGLGYSYNQLFTDNPLITLALVLTTSVLLVSSLPMFSLKLKNINFANNKWQYALIVLSAILLCVMRLDAIMWIIVLYVLLSGLKAFRQ